jgi:hypothetical protein
MILAFSILNEQNTACISNFFEQINEIAASALLNLFWDFVPAQTRQDGMWLHIKAMTLLLSVEFVAGLRSVIFNKGE